MKTSTHLKMLAGAAGAIAVLAAPRPVAATPLLLNGGFESGFAAWTRLDQIGSDGTFMLQSGTLSPVNLEPVPPPTEGTTAAMTDQQGPGSHVLYQDFFVPTGTTSGTIAFDLFVGNRAEDFFSPGFLDFSTPTLNQQARVDILLATADPFSTNAADVLLTLYQTLPGDPLVSGYNTIATDISALLAANQMNTLRLRFAEVDNVSLFQLGVDNVRVESNLQAIPEPATLLLIGSGLVGFAAKRRTVHRGSVARRRESRS